MHKIVIIKFMQMKKPLKHLKNNNVYICGLLCFNCNTSLGKLGDTLEGLTKAINYLLGLK